VLAGGRRNAGEQCASPCCEGHDALPGVRYEPPVRRAVRIETRDHVIGAARDQLGADEYDLEDRRLGPDLRASELTADVVEPDQLDSACIVEDCRYELAGRGVASERQLIRVTRVHDDRLERAVEPRPQPERALVIVGQCRIARLGGRDQIDAAGVRRAKRFLAARSGGRRLLCLGAIGRRRRTIVAAAADADRTHYERRAGERSEPQGAN
jgi:hypothetical protein